MTVLRYLRDLPSRLSRITSGGRYIAEIDGLRFLAIMPVLFLHLGERMVRKSPSELDMGSSIIGHFAHHGYIGVFIFFTISGFILGLPFANYHLKAGKKVKLKNYFLRRLTRLEPPYIIILCLLLIASLWVGYRHENLSSHFLAGIFYLHCPIYGEFNPINPVTWSLEVEVQFYIMAPLLAKLFFSIKRMAMRRILLVVSILVIAFLQNLAGQPSIPYYLSLACHLHFFLAGFLLCDIYLLSWQKSYLPSLAYDLLLLIILPLIFSLRLWQHELLDWTALPFLIIFSFYAVFKSHYFRKFFTLRWVTLIGGMCYTIYLIHLAIAELLIKYSYKLVIAGEFGISLIIQSLLYIPLVLVISSLLFVSIERPCMDKEWPQKLLIFMKHGLAQVKLTPKWIMRTKS